MICTLIKNSNGTKEVQFGEQHLTRAWGIEYYTYKDLSEADIKRISEATTEEVQRILNELF